jgi:hypothetical protein
MSVHGGSTRMYAERREVCVKVNEVCKVCFQQIFVLYIRLGHNFALQLVPGLV